jgi:hypothetical protein
LTIAIAGWYASVLTACQPFLKTHRHMTVLQRRPSPALIVASLALFVALGSGATITQQITRTAANAPSLTYSPITLQNGWTGAPFGTRAPAVALDTNGTVHFKGAMATVGTNSTAFTLALRFRPSAAVYVTVDMCNATQGRLQINTNGAAFVEPEGAFSNASCFTSLDGVTYTK